MCRPVTVIADVSCALRCHGPAISKQHPVQCGYDAVGQTAPGDENAPHDLPPSPLKWCREVQGCTHRNCILAFPRTLPTGPSAVRLRTPQTWALPAHCWLRPCSLHVDGPPRPACLALGCGGCGARCAALRCLRRETRTESRCHNSAVAELPAHTPASLQSVASSRSNAWPPFDLVQRGRRGSALQPSHPRTLAVRVQRCY
jgi:hypothetical protein